MIDVKSRAHRILKPLAAYTDLSECEWFLDRLPSLPIFVDSERALGVYSLDLEQFTDAVLFTTDGIALRENRFWTRLRYDNIDRTIMPNEKTQVTGFAILCRDGQQFWLPVKGSRDGRFYDAFEVLRFIDRVRSDITRANPT